MSSLYANTGVDLNLILYSGTGASETGIIDDTGQDLGYKYSSGSVGYDLGFVAKSGQDIGRILGGEVAAVWRSKETDASTDSASVIDSAWHYVTMFKNTSEDWTKIEASSETRHLGLHANGSLWRKTPKCSAVAYHVTALGTDGSIDISLGTPSSNDGKVWIDEIRSPNSYTKNFVVCGLGGTDYYEKFVSGYTNDYGDYVESHWERISILSYVTLTITAKVNNVATRRYTMTFSY